MTLNESLVAFQRMEAAFKAGLEEFNTAQAAGQMGLEAYRRAKGLNEELIALGTTLSTNLDQVLASL